MPILEYSTGVLVLYFSAVKGYREELGVYLGFSLDITLELKYELELVAVINVGLLFAIALG